MEFKTNEFITNYDINQLNDFKNLFENIVKNKIDTKIITLDVFGFVTKEPVKYENIKDYQLKQFKQNESWGKLFDCAWFNLKGKIPNYNKDIIYDLKLDLSGEALLYNNEGTPLKGFTNGSSAFDRSLGEPGKLYYPINKLIKEDGTLDLWIEGAANDLFGNLSDEGKILITDIVVRDKDLLKLYYDIEFLYSLLTSISNLDKRYKDIKDALFNVFILVIYEEKDYVAKAFDVIKKITNSTTNKSLDIYAVGHAHMDLAWLWPIRETKRKIARTLTNVFYLLENYDDFIFGISQPQMLVWVEKEYPDLFKELTHYINLGRIELQGGMWVEPDTNVSGEEALVRQMLYGIKYYQEKFGFRVKNLWLPDVFGYSGNLPQIIKKSGIDYFMTIKISWNLVNEFPHHTFNWEGIDGSEVFTHMPPEGTYNSAALPSSHIKSINKYKEKEESPHILSVFGIGNGGGGPGVEHVERINRQKDFDPLPNVKYSRADAFFEKVKKYEEKVPTYKGELYLENHQGTFTSQSNVKKYNRLLEQKLKSIETYLTLTKRIDKYQDVLTSIWEEVLLYQFHDILPGTSIKRVYEEAIPRYHSLNKKLDEIVKENSNDNDLLFNPLLEKVNFIKKINNKYLEYNINPLSFNTYQKEYSYLNKSMDISFLTKNTKIIFDDKTGFIKSLIYRDKEMISNSFGNELLVYKDLGDAWNILDHYRKQTPIKMELTFREVNNYGDITEVTQHYKFNKSTLIETIVINKNDDLIKFNHELDWQDLNYMLRTTFPLNIKTETARFDIQFGDIVRRRTNNDSKEIAQFEVPGQKWVNIFDGNHSFNLINDSKYGYYIKDDIIDLNLHRSTNYPALNGDIEKTSYQYAFYFSDVDYIKSNLDHLAEIFNTVFLPLNKVTNIDTIKVDNNNITYSTIKQSEDNKGYIVRLYNKTNLNQDLTLTLNINYEKIELTNLVEEAINELDNLEFKFTPYEIKTIKIVL